MKPRKLNKELTKNSNLRELQETLNKYLLGEDSFLNWDLRSATTSDIFARLNPFINRQDKGVFMVFEDHIAKDNKGYTRYSELYNKLLAFQKDAKQSLPYIMQIYFLSAIKDDGDSTMKGIHPPYSIRLTQDPNATNSGTEVTFSEDYSKKAKEKLQVSLKLAEKNIAAAEGQDSPKVKVKVYVRLYPTQGLLSLPTRQIKTQILSNNEVLQTSSKKLNLRVLLNGNLALNTLDTQWLDAYHTFFDYWIDAGNKKFQLLVGDYTLNNCYLETTPSLVQPFGNATSFDLRIVSSISDAEEIK